MNLTGNTILITGGGSGIGRALAEAFLERGNTVIVTGRNSDKLADVAAAHPDVHSYQLDMDDVGALASFSSKIVADFPDLNMLINNAGIMRPEKILDGSTATAEAIISTNLLGPIRLTTALLPHLVSKEQAAVMNVIRAGLYPARGLSDLLRNQGCHPLLHPVASCSVARHIGCGGRIGPALCADGAHRRAPGSRSKCHAACGLHRRNDGSARGAAGCG